MNQLRPSIEVHVSLVELVNSGCSWLPPMLIFSLLTATAPKLGPVVEKPNHSKNLLLFKIVFAKANHLLVIDHCGRSAPTLTCGDVRVFWWRCWRQRVRRAPRQLCWQRFPGLPDRVLDARIADSSPAVATKLHVRSFYNCISKNQSLSDSFFISKSHFKTTNSLTAFIPLK